MSKFLYVVKRESVTYKNGKESGVYYFGSIGLFGFVMMESEIEKAKKFQTKKEAEQMAKMLGSRFHVVKINKDNEGAKQ